MHWPQLLQHWLTCPFINACQFPNCLKNAELSPAFKKEDYVNKTNFMPVSILIWFTKKLKSCIVTSCWISSTNLCLHFYMLSEKVTAVKQSWLKWLKTEDWRKCLSEHKIVAAMIWATHLTDWRIDFYWLNLAHVAYPMIVPICSCPIYPNVYNV